MPASPEEDRGWECRECLSENDEEDHMCWICNVGLKEEADENKRSQDRQFEAIRLAMEMRSPTRNLAERPQEVNSQLGKATPLERPHEGVWKKDNPFGELGDDEDMGDDQDISITVGIQGASLIKKGSL